MAIVSSMTIVSWNPHIPLLLYTSLWLKTSLLWVNVASLYTIRFYIKTWHDCILFYAVCTEGEADSRLKRLPCPIIIIILAFSYKQIYCTSCCKSVHNKILHESVTWLYFILSSLHIRKGWFQTLVDYVKNMVTCLSLGVTFNHMVLSSAWESLGKWCC